VFAAALGWGTVFEAQVCAQIGGLPMAVYTLPPLPYDAGALAPHVSAELMTLHHDKHHAAYVKGANETLERLADAEEWTVAGLERALAFNVNGHLLHSLFWTSMSPHGGNPPDGELGAAIDDSFGSFDALTKRFTACLTTVQGSGWAALVWEPTAGRLLVSQLRDHEDGNLADARALLVADAWEHAYYLDYRNEKAKWAAAFLAVADWESAATRFEHMALAQSGRA
jgi:superoxide dismutase, Fe-Mn family